MPSLNLLEDDLASASYEEVLSALQGFRDESERVEFKREMPDRSKLVQTACAFANAYGGIIAVGIEDADKGLTMAEPPPDISNRAQTAVLSRILSRTYPSVRCQSFSFTDGKHAIMLIRVPRTTIGPHEYLGNDGKRLPVRRDKSIDDLHLVEIEALQQRRDNSSLRESPLGAHHPLVNLQPPVTKRNTNNAQLSFVGAAIYPQEFLPTTKTLYEDDETAIQEAVLKCAGLDGLMGKTMRDGLLFSTGSNAEADAKSQRDLYIQSDGEIALRMEYTADHDIYQLSRLFANVLVLASGIYSHLGLVPRISGVLKIEINEPAPQFLPRNWRERFDFDLAHDDIVEVAGTIFTLVMRGSGRPSHRNEMRDHFQGVWGREYQGKGVAEPRTLWP